MSKLSAPGEYHLTDVELRKAAADLGFGIFPLPLMIVRFHSITLNIFTAIYETVLEPGQIIAVNHRHSGIRMAMD